MRNRFSILIVGAILALLIVGILPAAVQAAQTQIDATGNINNISGVEGHQPGNSGNFIVKSRTVTGSFVSGDLSGDYTFKYSGAFDLNTQAGKIMGDLTNGSHVFNIKGQSRPFSQSGNTLVSTASGTWKMTTGSGYGNWDATYVLILGDDGHVVEIGSGSSFTLSGIMDINP